MLVWGSVLVCGVSSVHAGEVDLLIQKLVEKNILSANEAQILLDDTKQEVAKQNALAKNDAIPAWVQSIKMKGDLRLRYQTEKKDEGSTTRNRARVRYRLGVEAKPNAQFTVGRGWPAAVLMHVRRMKHLTILFRQTRSIWIMPGVSISPIHL